MSLVKCWYHYFFDRQASHNFAAYLFLSYIGSILATSWFQAGCHHRRVIRGYKRVDFMLYQLLTWLAKRFGSEVEQGHLIDMILTHQDIAEIIGTSRVTVTRTLGHFEQQGLIDRLPLHRIILQPSEVWHYEI